MVSVCFSKRIVLAYCIFSHPLPHLPMCNAMMRVTAVLSAHRLMLARPVRDGLSRADDPRPSAAAGDLASHKLKLEDLCRPLGNNASVGTMMAHGTRDWGHGTRDWAHGTTYTVQEDRASYTLSATNTTRASLIGRRQPPRTGPANLRSCPRHLFLHSHMDMRQAWWALSPRADAAGASRVAADRVCSPCLAPAS